MRLPRCGDTGAQNGHEGEHWLLPCSVLVLICLWGDVAFLFASPYPYGTDGYYYTALAEFGADATLGRSVAFLPAVLLRAFGSVFAPAVAAKLVGLACLYATGAAAFLLMRRLSRSVPLAFLAFFLVVKGFMRAELLVNFPKQSLGHLWVVLLALCLLASWPAFGGKKWLCAAFLVSAAALTHSIAFALCLMLVGSYLMSEVLTRTRLRRPLAVFIVVGWTAPWLGTFLTALAPDLGGPWRHMLNLSTSPMPHLNVPLLYDGLSPITRFFPATMLEVAALCLAVAACVAVAVKLDARKSDAPHPSPLCTAALLFLPQVALTFSPFFIGGDTYPLGLHFRLVSALGVAAAVIVPAGIAMCPWTRTRCTALALILAAVLALLPPAWSASVLPPADGGALHQAMVRIAPEIPTDAVIITSLHTGNMVTALWRRPRVIATRFDPDVSQANYYRFSVFHPDVRAELETFAAQHGAYPQPRQVLGPWWLVKEELYRDFREHLQATNPDLAQKLVE